MRDTNYPDFGMIQPRDGSTGIHKDYLYYPETDLHVGSTGPIGTLVLRLQRKNPNPALPDLPLTLIPGNSLRVPVHNGFSVGVIRMVTGNIVEFTQRLGGNPIPGHQVRQIKCYHQAYIDAVIQDMMAKGKLKVAGGRFIER